MLLQIPFKHKGATVFNFFQLLPATKTITAAKSRPCSRSLGHVTLANNKLSLKNCRLKVEKKHH